MPHKYITIANELGRDYGSAARTERIRQRLQEERAAHRSAEAGSYDATIAAKNIANLEEALERAESNQALRTEQRNARQAERTAQLEANRAEQQAALEAELRRRYNLALPRPVTDAEWAAVRESVLHRHALREMDQTDALIKQTADRYRF